MFIEGFTVFSEQEYGKTTETREWLKACSISALLLPEAQFSHCILSLTWLSSDGAGAQVSPAWCSVLPDTSLYHQFPNHSQETGAFLQKLIYMVGLQMKKDGFC